MNLSKKLFALTALVAAGAMAPAAFGGLATANLTLRPDTGDATSDGLPVTKSVNLANETTTIEIDASGRTRKVIDGLGKVSTAVYDANGNQLSRRDATGAGTDYVYDALNRRTTETDASISGRVRSYAYDLANRLITATDPLGVVTTYGYDLRDRKISESTPMNGTTNRLIQYGYDGRGHMTTLTDANNAVTTWGFDNSGRQITKLYANGDHRSMAYDAAGRLVTLTDENGHDIVSAYDLAGRLLSKAFAADSTTDTYAYDEASRMTSVTKGRYAHTLTYAYDSVGRLASESHPDGEVINYAYDTVNRLGNLSVTNLATSLTGDSYSVAYAYDGRGQMSSVTSGDYASNYVYRDNGQLASTLDVRTASPTSDILRADRTYDAGARLTQVSNTAINGDQVGVIYTLGADDQRLTATEETGQKWNYGYDGLKQLVTANKTDTSAVTVPPLDQTYTYDPMGNRSAYTESGTSVAYTKNNANQYTGIVSTGAIALSQSPTYDANGNMLSDGVKNYAWDAENQLVSVTPVAPLSGDLRADFTYDWRMRRSSKTTSVYTSGAWAVQKITKYKYREWNLLEETVANASGVIGEVKRYVWGNDLSSNMHGAGGVGGLLSMTDSTGSAANTYFHAYDGNGNVRALAKADALTPTISAMVEKYAYDGFGREIGAPIIGSVNSVRFSTKQLDVETGMNYYGYRYYASRDGRWINRDPINERGGRNVYSFVENHPIRARDVNGLSPCHTDDEYEARAYYNDHKDDPDFKAKLQEPAPTIVVAAMTPIIAIAVVAALPEEIIGGAYTAATSAASWAAGLFASTAVVAPIVQQEIEQAEEEAPVIEQEATQLAQNVIERTAQSEVAPAARNFLAGKTSLAEVPADVAEKAASYLEEVEAPLANTAADAAYQLARAKALRGEGPPPGPITAWRTNFGK